FTSIICAQSTNVSRTGCITHPSKALFVEAKVAAISTDTNARYETTTNFHSIDNASTDAFAHNLNPPGVTGAKGSLGNSDFDIRQALTAGENPQGPDPHGNLLATLLHLHPRYFAVPNDLVGAPRRICRMKSRFREHAPSHPLPKPNLDAVSSSTEPKTEK